MSIEKIQLHIAAAILTQAATAHEVQTLPLPQNGTVSDGLKAVDLEVWEVHRIFYNALQQTLSDDNPADGWPAPPSAPVAHPQDFAPVVAALAPLLGSLGATAISALTPLASGSAAGLVQALLKALPGSGSGSAAPAPNLPNPGAAAK